MPAILISVILGIGLNLRFSTGAMPATVGQTSVHMLFLICSLTLLFLVGIADDLIGVRYRAKFLFQIIGGVLVVISGMWVSDLYGFLGIEQFPDWLGWALTVLLVVYVTNAINLIDGVDGLASGLAIMICGCYAALFAIDYHWFYATVSLCTVGVLIPFFSYNVFGTVERGTKIFMGDTGSLTIGFLISFLTIAYCGDQDSVSANPMLTCFALLMVPCLDVLRVMLHRARKGLPIFLPDRNHIHHKLIDAGCSTKQTLAVVIGLSLGYAALNFGLQRVLNIHLLILLDVLSWTVFNVWLTWLIKCRKANNKVCLS